MLGHWEEAFCDLSKSCQLDYDDDANQALHEVEPRVCHHCLFPFRLLCVFCLLTYLSSLIIVVKCAIFCFLLSLQKTLLRQIVLLIIELVYSAS